jgi:hypothetical protein
VTTGIRATRRVNGSIWWRAAIGDHGHEIRIKTSGPCIPALALSPGGVNARTKANKTAVDATTIMIFQSWKRTGGTSPPRHQPFATVASRIATTGDRPGVRPTETSSARSNSFRPREAENRDRPISARSSNRERDIKRPSRPAPTYSVLSRPPSRTDV